MVSFGETMGLDIGGRRVAAVKGWINMSDDEVIEAFKSGESGEKAA
jgi:hypothetical protein